MFVIIYYSRVVKQLYVIIPSLTSGMQESLNLVCEFYAPRETFPSIDVKRFKEQVSTGLSAV